jgi:hypothetical protein
MSSDRPSDTELRRDVDLMLCYRRMPPLAEMIYDADHRSTVVSMYRVVRHFMGEPISVWLALMFGENKRITH